MTEGEAAWTPLEPRCLMASLYLPNAISCLILLIDALVWELLALDGLASVLISSMMAFRERFPGSKLYLYALVDSPVSVSSKNIWNEQKSLAWDSMQVKLEFTMDIDLSKASETTLIDFMGIVDKIVVSKVDKNSFKALIAVSGGGCSNSERNCSISNN